ncbi:hypothetical protein RB195_003635 [Necator americanus]|uniref:Oxidoreductase, short chain dehydrogenase/reductase family protein n=1 Tax=Necator americanus TaxID=51031 RepID=A0ABR1DPG0_NECAM
MSRFSGRAVIVTGSSSGIGRAVALLFAREGAMVTICGRNEATLEESRRLIYAENGGHNDKIVVVSGNICDEEVMNNVIHKTLQTFGRLDVLVNNAGGTYGAIDVQGELEGDLEPFDYTFNLNLRSVLRLCQLAYPHLVKTKGEIVNVGSVAGLHNGASAPFPFYSITKAAQDQLTRNLAIHYIRKGVRVNSVNPGYISTSIIQKQGFADDVVKKGEEKMVSNHSRVPYQRTGKPEEVAEAVLFLADREKSGFILGHQLVIDGGSSLQMALISDGFKVFAEVAADSSSQF